MASNVSIQAKNYAKQAADLIKQNKINLAIDYYKKAIELDPKIPPKVYRELADALVQQRLLEKAIELLHLALQHHPDSYLAYSTLGNLLINQGEFENGIKNFQKSLQLNPNPKSWIYRKLGNQLLKSNRLAEAETVFQEFLKKYPDNPRAHHCLARVAIASQEWKLAVERLDVGISLFADQLDFILKKIDVLEKLDLFDRARETIQRGRFRFPNEVALDLAEAKLYRKKYDYQTAQTILDAATSKEPENLEVKLEKATNYWLLGKKQAANKILNQIRPTVDLANSSITTGFTKLYFEILQDNNQIDELKTFFEQLQANQVFNHNIIKSYYQFIISQGQYQSASHYIRDIIREKPINAHIYQTQVLLLFEIEKIKHIQKLEQLDFSAHSIDKGHVYLTSLLDKIELHLKSHSKFSKVNNGLREILEKIKQLSQQYPRSFLNTYISPGDTFEVASQIIKHIYQRIPLSLIRLGDAEGMFLEYEEEWPEFQEKDRQKIQRIYWGCNRIDRDEWQTLKDDYWSTLQNADILGIPEPHRFCREFRPEFARQGYRGELRGLITIINTLLDPQFCQKPHNRQLSSPTLTSCHIHHNLEAWGLYPLIFNQIKDCSVISCHQGVVQILQKRYGIAVNKIYTIPAEYRYSQLFDYDDRQNRPHYPDYYRKICSEIKVLYPGEVFLVGAGLLGKIYCNIIKKRGGIALDIGSMTDYWLNYNTRSYLNFHHSFDNYTPIFSKILEQDYQISQLKDNCQQKQVSIEKTTVNHQEVIAQYCAQGETAIKTIQSPQVYQKLGRQLLKQKRFAEAEEIFHKLTTEYPGKPQGYIGLARVAMSSLQWPSAQQRWDKVLELFPENIPAFVGLGNTLIELKKYEQAEAIFQELLEKYPEKPQGYEGLANLAKATYQWELAVKWWDISINKTRAQSSYLHKSRFLISHAYYEAGFEIIDNLITERGEDLELLKFKANSLISASRFHEASELLHPLQGQNPDSLAIQQLLAQALIGAHRFQEANQIIAKLPNYQEKSISSYNDPDRILRLLKTWQKYYQAGIDLDQPKIFGIGLSRTGTTSLTEALNLLGYVSIHFINPITKRVIDLEDIFYYDAFTDSPISFRFEELYFLFPNAKFIYTERNLVDWVNSSSNLYKPKGFSTTKGMKAWLTQPENGQFNKFFHSYHPTYRCAYESLYANYPTWEDAYHAFENRVTKFFADKPVAKFLKLNICAGEGWEKLCKFLDVPIPEQSFPYYNKENAKSRPAS